MVLILFYEYLRHRGRHSARWRAWQVMNMDEWRELRLNIFRAVSFEVGPTCILSHVVEAIPCHFKPYPFDVWLSLFWALHVGLKASFNVSPQICWCTPSLKKWIPWALISRSPHTLHSLKSMDPIIDYAPLSSSVFLNGPIVQSKQCKAHWFTLFS